MTVDRTLIDSSRTVCRRRTCSWSAESWIRIRSLKLREHVYMYHGHAADIILYHDTFGVRMLPSNILMNIPFRYQKYDLQWVSVNGDIGKTSFRKVQHWRDILRGILRDTRTRTARSTLKIRNICDLTLNILPFALYNKFVIERSTRLTALSFHYFNYSIHSYFTLYIFKKNCFSLFKLFIGDSYITQISQWKRIIITNHISTENTIRDIYESSNFVK